MLSVITPRLQSEDVVDSVIDKKASEMLVAPRISECFGLP